METQTTLIAREVSTQKIHVSKQLIVLFYNATCSMGMSLHLDKVNILMYICNTSCLHVDGV